MLRAVGVMTSIFGGNGSSAGTDWDEKLKALVSEVAAMSNNEELFQERIAELELALEDAGWKAVGGLAGDFQFTRDAISDIIHLSRLYYLKNPVIKRPVDLQAHYVWAQGVSIYAEGEEINDIVQGFLADPSNRRSLTSHDALMDAERRLRVEGNLFLRFFTNPNSGRVQLRKLPVDEMRAVIYNPEDRDEPWFYVRRFLRDKQEVTVAYPDWQYARQRKVEDEVGADASGLPRGGVSMDALAEYEDAEIYWETPVMHVKTGAFGDMDFGVPETYAAIDWARAYKEALEDYKKTIKSLAKWAWKMKMGGGQAQLNAAAQALGTTFGSDDTWTEDNPAPVGGSLFAYTGDMDMRAIDVSKAAIDPDGFRRLLLMAASAMGMPEVYYGAAEGSFATAKVMDRPSELQFRARQEMWAEVLTDCLTIAVEAAARAPGFDGVSSAGYDERTDQMKLRAGGKDATIHIEVDFPPILQKDVQEFMQALVTFTTQNGQALQAMNDGPTLYRMALTALGVDNVEEIIDIFYPKDGSPSKAKEIETYEAPLPPEDVNQQRVDKAKADAEIAKINAQTPAASLGNQPRSQGPAGADKSPTGRGGPNATARSSAREAMDIAEAQARLEFMGSLMAMRGEIVNGRDPEQILERLQDNGTSEAMLAVAEAMRDLASRETEPPVINVAAPAVTVESPAITVEPAVVNVTPEIVCEAPEVTISAAKRTKRTSSFVLDDAGRIVGKEEVEEREDG